MTSIILTFAAVFTVLYCSADQLPPPTNLMYNWSDAVTVDLTWSWQRPSTLPKNCEIKYEINFLNRPTRVLSKNFTPKCPTVRNYTVRTVVEHCNGWIHSTPVPIEVNQRSQDKVVKNFRCVVDCGGINCSWIPRDRTLDLTFSYCACSVKSEGCKPLKDCDRLYTSGNRSGCFMMGVHPSDVDFLFLVKSAKGEDVVPPGFVLPSPKLSVTQMDKLLKLTWTPPAGNCRNDVSWRNKLCFSQCGGKEQCYDVPSMSHEIPYEENCKYTFRSKVLSNYTGDILSDWSEDVTYGTTKPPDATLTVVAIVIPIILFICVTLSCYCFSKHRDIIFPNTPDPSAIFKELMSGNKEHESKPESLYTPLPEEVERCTISPAS